MRHHGVDVTSTWWALAAAALVVLSGCGPADPATTEAGTGDRAPASTTLVSESPSTTSAGDGRAVLAPLRIDDQPRPPVRYDRGAWPHWDDVDGDGCDARQQALKAASTTPPQVDPYGCAVIAGDWVSAYDGIVLTEPSEMDVDHIVPLENAHTSGGWAWPVEHRRAFANDQANLWPVSATSNRQKGSTGPEGWRPAVQATWCDYATRWVTVKVTYGLTATTAERDALGQMLDTCAGTSTTIVAPSSTASMPEPEPSTVTTTAVTVPPAAGPPFATCSEARAAGAAPILRGEPGYRPPLDGDGDGVACE